jgi:hypothetical protein
MTLLFGAVIFGGHPWVLLPVVVTTVQPIAAQGPVTRKQLLRRRLLKEADT